MLLIQLRRLLMLFPVYKRCRYAKYVFDAEFVPSYQPLGGGRRSDHVSSLRNDRVVMSSCVH